MHDDLVKRLRSQCRGYGKECEDCNADGNCRSQMENEAADAIEELSRENESLARSVNEASEILRRRWIPVEERLPDDGEYLVSINTIPPHQIIEVCSFAKDLYKIDKYEFRDKKRKSGFYGCDGEYGYFERTGITHWMPLPEPPKEDK